MELKFTVEAINRSLRSKNEMKSIHEGTDLFFDEFIEALDAQITVTGLPSPCLGGSSMIKLHYVEKYNAKSAFSDFYTRAEKFAMDYCEKLGMVNKVY